MTILVVDDRLEFAENIAEIPPLADEHLARIATLESGVRTGTAPEDRP